MIDSRASGSGSPFAERNLCLIYARLWLQAVEIDHADQRLLLK
jgi:hypothetical protein